MPYLLIFWCYKFALVGVVVTNCYHNECTKSANPRCLYDGHCTMHRTETVPSMHACPAALIMAIFMTILK